MTSDPVSPGAAPPPAPYPPDGTPPGAAPSTPDERTYAIILHLSGFLFPILGPLVMWLIRKNESAYIDHHGKEALNFHITLWCAAVILILLSVVTCGIGAVIAVPLLFVLGIVNLVCMILAAIAANAGRWYRYPMTVRLLK